MRMKGAEMRGLIPLALSWPTSCSKRTRVRTRGPSTCAWPRSWTFTSCWGSPSGTPRIAAGACHRCCVQYRALSFDSIGTVTPCIGSRNLRCISSRNSLSTSLSTRETQALFGLTRTKTLRGSSRRSLHLVEGQRSPRRWL